MDVARWTHRNLATQGYCLTDEEARSQALGLRFPTALCLALVLAALLLQSPAMLLALAGIGVVAGFARRHPFDHLWNHGLRHAFGAPVVPPTPRPRRHAFKLATVWLLAVAVLFVAGADALALALGGLLLAACSAVTFFNYCVPSTMLAWLEARRGPRPRPASA